VRRCGNGTKSWARFRATDRITWEGGDGPPTRARFLTNRGVASLRRSLRGISRVAHGKKILTNKLGNQGFSVHFGLGGCAETRLARAQARRPSGRSPHGRLFAALLSAPPATPHIAGGARPRHPPARKPSRMLPYRDFRVAR
jgi:hypothetical protein